MVNATRRTVEPRDTPAKPPGSGGADLAARFVVRAAILAPSIHNTQPWRFVDRPDGLELWADRVCLLPITDPAGREMSISCGAALFNARLAVRRLGFTPKVRLLPNPAARARLRLLGGPAAFAWRSTRGMLTGWLLGVAGYAFVAGTLIATVLDFAADDPSYQRVVESLGWDAGDIADGFVGVMGILIGLLIALYACWRIGAARAEEAAGRLDHVLTRPVARGRWLGGHVLLTLASALLLALTSAVTMWAGAAATDSGVGIEDTLAATLNPLPVAALAMGLAVLLFGAWPRLAVPGSVATAVVAYLIETIGPALDWPEAILAVSPFHYIASVPAEPFEPVPAVIMVASAALLTLAGHVLFEYRDLTGD